MRTMLNSLSHIRYHRISDNSVTLFSVPKSSTEAVIGGLKQNSDVDRIWTFNNGVFLYAQLKRESTTLPCLYRKGIGSTWVCNWEGCIVCFPK